MASVVQVSREVEWERTAQRPARRRMEDAAIHTHLYKPEPERRRRCHMAGLARGQPSSADLKARPVGQSGR